MISLRPNASMSKKLSRAKKALKSFTSKVQSKLHKLNIPKTIKTTTRRLLASRCFRFFVPSKLRTLTKPTSTFSTRNQYYNHHYDAFQSHIGYAPGKSRYQHHNKVVHNKNAAAIHIDELFAEPAVAAETSKGKQVLDDDDDEEDDKKVVKSEKKSLYSVEDAWREVVAKSPQLRVVDERAEEFICKFRQEMKLQKERSMLEFQEMLARSS